MLGQPPSLSSGLEEAEPIVSSKKDEELRLPSSDDSLGLQEVMKLIDPQGEVHAKRGFDPSVYILRERLDEKETMLMDGIPNPSRCFTYKLNWRTLCSLQFQTYLLQTSMEALGT